MTDPRLQRLQEFHRRKRHIVLACPIPHPLGMILSEDFPSIGISCEVFKAAAWRIMRESTRTEFEEQLRFTGDFPGFIDAHGLRHFYVLEALD